MAINGIFLKVDPVFALVNETINEISKAERKEHIATRGYSLKDVESSSGQTDFQNLYDLYRRISIGVRTCALESLDFELPVIKDAIKNANFYKFYEKNRECFSNHEDVTMSKNPDITKGKDIYQYTARARYIAGELDRLHPWLAIDAFFNADDDSGNSEDFDESKTSSSEKGASSGARRRGAKKKFPRTKIMSGMAYIFYDNFTNLIQINTTIKIKDIGPRVTLGLRYSCPSITALCQHHMVKKTSVQYPDGNFMLLLKAMIKEHGSMEKDRADLVTLMEDLDIKHSLVDLVKSINVKASSLK